MSEIVEEFKIVWEWLPRAEGYSPRSEPEATSSLRRSPEERWVKPYLSKD